MPLKKFRSLTLLVSWNLSNPNLQLVFPGLKKQNCEVLDQNSKDSPWLTASQKQGYFRGTKAVDVTVELLLLRCRGLKIALDEKYNACEDDVENADIYITGKYLGMHSRISRVPLNPPNMNSTYLTFCDVDVFGQSPEVWHVTPNLRLHFRYVKLVLSNCDQILDCLFDCTKVYIINCQCCIQFFF